MAIVKCADCGLVAMRRHDATRELLELESTTRDKGQLDPIIDGKVDNTPVCLARVAPFYDEMHGPSLTQAHAVEKRRRVLNQERECPEFMPWEQGFSPKEHLEMRHHERLLAIQRAIAEEHHKWQQQQAHNEQEWRERQAARERQWRLEDQHAAEEALKRERYKGWTVAAWAFASATITWLIALSVK